MEKKGRHRLETFLLINLSHFWSEFLILMALLDQSVKLGRSVRFVSNVNVVNESFVWCR